jgi:hypothetical protein
MWIIKVSFNLSSFNSENCHFTSVRMTIDEHLALHSADINREFFCRKRNFFPYPSDHEAQSPRLGGNVFLSVGQ